MYIFESLNCAPGRVSDWSVSLKIEKHNRKFCDTVTDERFRSASIYRVEKCVYTIRSLGEIRRAGD